MVTIEHIVNDFLAGSSVFLVTYKKSADKLRVVLDGFSGVDIETCTKLSRHLQYQIDQGLLENISIEVTSFGIGSFLMNTNQIKANVGRKVVLSTDTDGSMETNYRLAGVDGRYAYLLQGRNLEPHALEGLKIKVEVEF
ncbi:MAG: hypothetical protein HYZ16_00440 [Bacteroidetes bacterium]|jgi:ribosome maturation factor RimP|nr:hypothetical protein [Bacteroidota bacterium]